MWRLVVLTLCFLCNTCLYISRANMSVAVVFMFPDDPHTSSIVLSAFYWGYAISQIPGGALVGRFGGQCVLACAVLAWSVATFATTPFGLLSVVANATASGESSASASAHPPLLGFIGLCLCRAVVGVAEGWNYPSQVGLISRWIPVEERSRAWAFLSCGEQLGTIIALLFCPAMAVKLGWSSIFWFSGVVGVVWAVAFVALSASTPARHRCIGSEERAMIERSRPDPATTTSRISGGANVKASRRVPWCRFLRNGPFIALMITHFCYNWGYYVVLSWIPSYFSSKFGLDYLKMGIYSVLPYIVLALTTNLAGCVADCFESNEYCGGAAVAADGVDLARIGSSSSSTIPLLPGAPHAREEESAAAAALGTHAAERERNRKRELKTGRARKALNTLGLLLPAACFVGLAFVRDDQPHVAIALLSMGVGLGGFCMAGYWSNFMDLHPKYSPQLLGISNSFASLPGIIGNWVVGLILKNEAKNWGLVFSLAAGVMAVGAVTFLFFASGAKQPFDDDVEDEASVKEEEATSTASGLLA